MKIEKEKGGKSKRIFVNLIINNPNYQNTDENQQCNAI